MNIYRSCFASQVRALPCCSKACVRPFSVLSIVTVGLNALDILLYLYNKASDLFKSFSRDRKPNLCLYLDN